ncbi:MAG: 4-hydroxy-3-methylbut-2-enyl diphosphate reductase, partial [Roseburia sp.]|nr:4-hydroxy-3-methylbut-2-enyl diphosphate reductase [Roseburia sp.]
MEVRIDRYAGFCFGVRRAVDTVYEQLEKGKTIYTYGPIVHNETVVGELGERGVKVLESREALEALADSVEGREAAVVIRAHGVPEEIFTFLREREIECVDATCPFVERIHRIVREESAAGKPVVIVGNPGHPEVEGILGSCRGRAYVVETPEEAEKLAFSDGEKISIVSQTTFNYNKFHYIVEIFQKKGYNVIVADTICSATQQRQQSAKALAAEADVMIVIGGKHSSNTRKLYEICREECADTYLIQKLDDLRLKLPKAVCLVGITAGAST